jgi:hydroxypyruvate isomerase
MPIKQSVCIPITRPNNFPLDAFFAELSKIGYIAVEFWDRSSDFEEICNLAVSHKLQLASMIGHGTIADGFNNVANHPRILAELEESFSIAKAKKMSGIICFSGNRQNGQSISDAAKICSEGLKKAAILADKAGVNLNLELLNSKVDHPGYQCDSTSWGIEVIKQVAHPRVKLLYDIYHMQIMEGDIIRTLTENIDYIGYIHTAGNPGRNDLDDFQELNYRGICRAIAKTKYSSFVGHEFKPKADSLAALKAAFEICNV